jgi:cytochrome o ubiquinol oxidase subunit 2
MNKKIKIVLLFVGVVGVIGIFAVLLNGHNIPVLNPKGTIADKQRDLIVFTTLLGLLVVAPVFVMLFTIAWKYRATNTKATYSPDWDHSRLYETIWWGIPCLIILVLGVVTWNATRDLDPYKPLASNVKPINIQVVALQWKWLFIYPDQGIATVNQIRFPEDTPINFEITADAPMNSFWIPSLGGQVYAMSGMSTKLHLMADQQGDYKGSSANISGEGFAGMKFTATATSTDAFNKWVNTTKKSTALDGSEYDKLAKPSKDVVPVVYALGQPDLYDTIVMKYMAPSTDGSTEMDHETMDMNHMEMQ